VGPPRARHASLGYEAVDTHFPSLIGSVFRETIRVTRPTDNGPAATTGFSVELLKYRLDCRSRSWEFHDSICWYVRQQPAWVAGKRRISGQAREILTVSDYFYYMNFPW